MTGLADLLRQQRGVMPPPEPSRGLVGPLVDGIKRNLASQQEKATSPYYMLEDMRDMFVGDFARNPSPYLRTMPVVGNPQGVAAAGMMMPPGIGDAMGVAADAMHYAEQPQDLSWQNLLGTGLGALPLMQSMVVWHGSPYKFDKFDASRIGTGEGAQVYGRGTYFAESPDVAMAYETPGTGVRYVDNAKSTMSPMATSVLDQAEDIDDALESLRQEMWHSQFARPDLLDEAKQAYDEILDAKAAGRISVHEGGGMTYKVDLPDEMVPKMLDWDSQIPGELYDKLSERIYLTPEVKNYTGEQLYKFLRDRVGGERMVPELLKVLDVPGIKYLDGMSRAKGEGTRNFVVFPGLEDQAKILERY